MLWNGSYVRLTKNTQIIFAQTTYNVRSVFLAQLTELRRYDITVTEVTFPENKFNFGKYYYECSTFCLLL